MEQETLLSVTSDDVRQAAHRIGPYVRTTPIFATAIGGRKELRLAVEPAAAVPFAAWLDGRVPGRHPCLVLCGANTDWHPE
jgi:threonine dehydratase